MKQKLLGGKVHRMELRAGAMMPSRGRVLRRERVYRLNIDMEFIPHRRVVESVLPAMLPTEIRVFAPDESIGNCLKGDEEVVCEGSRTVVAKDWLPLACQSIARGQLKDGLLGQYSHNLIRALLGGSYGERAPLGPAAMTGEIVISHCMSFNDERTTAAFCFVLAHELVHAVRYLPVIVPAYTGWRAFRRSFEVGTNAQDIVCDWIDTRNRFVDQYGGKMERQEVAEFWPATLVEEWWAALHSRQNRKGRRADRPRPPRK
ncbi:MAG TPA: hypothetical protein VM537_22460 [Anaerolineae bacterium]|nr:hypothetical protein [Anaerolineae bacterium]